MRLPSGLSLGLQIAAWEKEGKTRDNEYWDLKVSQHTRKRKNYGCDFLTGIRNLTMFRVEFTHFYASSWSWKPSDEYNPKKKPQTEAGYDIQTEERPWRPRADCAQHRTVQLESQRSLWSKAPPLTRCTQGNARLPVRAFRIKPLIAERRSFNKITQFVGEKDGIRPNAVKL